MANGIGPNREQVPFTVTYLLCPLRKKEGAYCFAHEGMLVGPSVSTPKQLVHTITQQPPHLIPKKLGR